jgi:uncharacterized protein
MNASHPPYQQLITALLRPFLSQPEALRIDCEYIPTHARVWVRIAFAEIDKEKLVGQGSRHLYATKAILAAAARESGQSVYLDLYDPNAGARRSADSMGGSSPSAEPRSGRSSSAPSRPVRRTESV